MDKVITKDSGIEKFLSIFSLRVSTRSRGRIIDLLMFLVVLCAWIGNTVFQLDSLIFYLFSCMAPFLIFVALNDRQYSKIKWNKIFCALFLCYAGTFTLGAIVTKRMGSIVLALTCMIAFPLIAKVTSTREKQMMLIESLMNALISNFYIIVVISVLIIDPDQQRQYSGIMINPNTLGLICLTTLIAFVFKIYFTCRGIHYIGVGVALAVLFFTQSRTSLICAVVLLVIILIYVIKNKKYEALKLGKLLVSVAFMAVMFVLVFHISPALPGGHDYVEKNWIREEVKEGEREVDLESREFDRLTESMSGDRDFTTGRMAIWEAYIEGIKLSPNDDDTAPVVNGEKLEISAHNTYIHLAYCFGLLCGVAYLLFNICVGIISLKRLKTNKHFLALLNLVTVISYGIVTLVETSYNFATYNICFMYWLFTFAVTIPDVGEDNTNG